MNNKIEILFEDEDLVIINKPANLVVNEAQTVTGATVQSWFSEILETQQTVSNWHSLVPADYDMSFGSPEEIFAQRNGIVHRLDKETSGVLILAKNPGSLVHVLKQFKERTTRKEYLCLAHGKFSALEDTINAPIGRASRDRKMFDVRVEGREAVTEYAIQAYYPHFDEQKWITLFKQSALENVNYHYSGNYKKYFKIYQGFSLVKCVPKTGRTHQIRVHMAHIQHPIVGDAVYTGKKREKADALWCARQFLHAARLTIQHPRTKESMVFEAPLPDDLRNALSLVVD